MKSKSAIKFFAVLIVVVFCAYLALCGLSVGESTIIKGYQDIRTGIDIRGGVSAQLQPQDVNLSSVTSEDLQSVKALIEKRLDEKGILDRTVSPDNEKKRVFLEIPWAANETAFDANALIEDTIEMAKLTFYEVEPYSEPITAAATAEPVEEKASSKKDNKSSKKNADKDSKKNDTGEEESKDYYEVLGEEGQGKYARVGDMILEGTQVTSANAGPDDQNNTVVHINFTSEGRQAFATATGNIAAKSNGMIGIFMDDTLISAATVKDKIDSEGCQIESKTFNDNKDEAIKLASRISAGNMPFKLSAVEVNTINATMGDSAYTVTKLALVIALFLIMLFMIFMYRLPGIAASIALLGHLSLSVLLISNIGITLTLPGIAGIILAIGMAVDGNCVIFERVKDELRAGRTLRSAVDAGFKRAFSAVFDGNVTTIICAAVLYYFGTGAIQSFAITTMIGVALSFISAITASRWLLQGTVDFRLATNKRWYGITEKSMERFQLKQERLGLVASSDDKKKKKKR